MPIADAALAANLFLPRQKAGLYAFADPTGTEGSRANRLSVLRFAGTAGLIGAALLAALVTAAISPC